MQSVKYIFWASVFQAVSWCGSDGMCSVQCIHVFRLQQSWMATRQQALWETMWILRVLDSERRAGWCPQLRKPRLERPACLKESAKTVIVPESGTPLHPVPRGVWTHTQRFSYNFNSFYLFIQSTKILTWLPHVDSRGRVVNPDLTACLWVLAASYTFRILFLRPKFLNLTSFVIHFPVWP